MRVLTRIFASLAAAAALVGLAIAQDFGPLPADFEDAAMEYIDSRLEDARGARYEFVSGPYQVYADIGRYESLPAWAVDVRVRSRMRSGIGSSFFTVIFVDGDPVALEEDVYRLTRL